MASSAALNKLHIHPICPVIVRSFVPGPSSTDSAIFVQIDTMSPHDDDDEEAGPSLIDSAQVLCDGLNMRYGIVTSSHMPGGHSFIPTESFYTQHNLCPNRHCVTS